MKQSFSSVGGGESVTLSEILWLVINMELTGVTGFQNPTN